MTRLPFDEIEQIPYEPAASEERLEQFRKDLQRYVESGNEADAERLLQTHDRMRGPFKTR